MGERKGVSFGKGREGKGREERKKGRKEERRERKEARLGGREGGREGESEGGKERWCWFMRCLHVLWVSSINQCTSVCTRGAMCEC